MKRLVFIVLFLSGLNSFSRIETLVIHFEKDQTVSLDTELIDSFKTQYDSILQWVQSTSFQPKKLNILINPISNPANEVYEINIYNKRLTWLLHYLGLNDFLVDKEFTVSPIYEDSFGSQFFFGFQLLYVLPPN